MGIVRRKNKKHVLCVGSVGKDIFLPTNCGVVAEASGGISTQKQWAFGYGGKMHIDDRFQALGGCACNVSIGLSRLGISATAYGIVGEDAEGEWIKSVLKSEDVNIRRIGADKRRASDLSMILVHESTGERTIFVNRDVGENLDLDEGAMLESEWIFVGSLYGDNTQDNMRLIHDAVMSGEKKFIYNPGMTNIKHQPRTVWDLIHHAKLLFVNKTEAREIIRSIVLLGDSQYNEEDLESEEKLLRKLADQMLPDAVVILTSGPDGAFVRYQGKSSHVPSRGTTAVDTTGAGDAFASGFIAAFIGGEKPAQCMRWGSANSHNVIAQYGGQKGLLNAADITHEIQKFDVQDLET